MEVFIHHYRNLFFRIALGQRVLGFEGRESGVCQNSQTSS